MITSEFPVLSETSTYLFLTPKSLQHYGGTWKTMWPTGGYGHKENMYTYRAMNKKLDKFQRA